MKPHGLSLPQFSLTRLEDILFKYKIESLAAAAAGVLYFVLLSNPEIAPRLVWGFALCALVGLAGAALHASKQRLSVPGLAAFCLGACGWAVGKLYALYVAGAGPYAVTAEGMAKGFAVMGITASAGGIGWAAYSAKQRGWKYRSVHIALPAHDTDRGLEIQLCRSQATGEPVMLKGRDRFTHQLVIGTTGTGKTTTVLFGQIFQDLVKKREGLPLGMTVIEPSGALVRTVARWCDAMGLPYVLIDLENPSQHFNPLEGPADVVAETTRTVLRATFGEQEAFFAQAQELHAKNTILLLKGIKGDNLDFNDLAKNLFNDTELHRTLDEYKRLYGTDMIVEYFEHEAFGKQQEKLRQFAMGLRLQVSDLLTNPNINYVLSGKSDIDMDKHLEQGGILLVNTAGGIGRLSDVFGMFMIMHLQAGIFRRPGTEKTRIPHILYVDEIGQYLNPEFARLLSYARQFRCACTFAIQGPSQLDLPRRKAFKNIIFSMCRTKIVFGGLEAEDAQVVSEMMGEETEKLVAVNRDRWQIWPKSYRETPVEKPRFSATDIMELGMWQVLVKKVEDGYAQPPLVGEVEPPWLLAERMENYLAKIPGHRTRKGGFTWP